MRCESRSGRIACWFMTCFLVLLLARSASVVGMPGVHYRVMKWYRMTTGLRLRVRPAFFDGRGVFWSAAYHLGDLDTGSAMSPDDAQLFVRIASILPAKRIFVVGNAWGYSAIMLATIFNGSSVDVLDGGEEGSDNVRAIELTRRVAARAGLDVSVTLGFSPRDIPRALRAPLGVYELVFIDGGHTNDQILQDFAGVLPFLSETAVIVFHDVGLWDLWEGLVGCICLDPKLRFFVVDGGRVVSRARVGLGFRGLINGSMASLRGRGGTWNSFSSRSLCERENAKPDQKRVCVESQDRSVAIC